MNETRTTSMLQRVPVILAVTASSYGLPLPARDTRRPLRHRTPKAAHGRRVAQG